MNKSCLLISSLLLGIIVTAQSNSSTLFPKEFSYYWKLDSLGQNGYRLCYYKAVLKSKFGKTDVKQLKKKFGEPNFMESDKSGHYYCYYYYNGRSIPKSEGFSWEIMYIFFKFDLLNQKLIAVKTASLD